MKRIIITMLVALIVIATTQARPVRKAVPNKPATEQATTQSATKDTPEVTANEDDAAKQDADNNPTIKVGDIVSIGKNGIEVKKNGKTVKVNMEDLDRIINEHLDDTVLSEAGITVDTDDEDGKVISLDESEMVHKGIDLAKSITEGFLIALVFIVFFSLLFYYLHRRRKYKTVDRAIQAGYPLPDEFFGKRSQYVPQQPTNVYVTQVTPPTVDTNAPEGTQPAPGMAPNYGQSSNPLNNITDWTPFKSGIKTTAWGVGLLFFFWILGAEPIAALMLIVIFVGLGKLFTTYQEQQSLKNYWQQQQWTQPQQGQSQQWQQWNPQQPDDVPPMPETPPEFNQ